MKNKMAQQVRVGIFVTLGLVLTMVVIFLLGDIGGLLERRYTVYARFTDISGLRLGAPIFLAGINVGEVEGIRFPRVLEEKKVVVTMRVNSEYRNRIREDSIANIVTQGLLGDKAIFITVGTPDYPEVENGGELQIRTGLSLETIGEKGGELIENINDLAKNLNGVLEDVRNKDSILHALLYEPEGEEIVSDLTAILRSAKDMVHQIQRGDGALHALIYEDTSKAFNNFQDISENLKLVSEKIEQGEGSVGGLINDPTVYYDLMTLLGNANRNKLLRTVIRATLATNEKDLTAE